MYCDFFSVVGQEKQIPRYLKAIENEIASSNGAPESWRIKTLFFGGGTPSLLSSQDIESLFNALSKKFDLSEIEEITLEANPGEAPESKLRDFKTLGINRISIGTQSFNPEYLKFLGRIHSVEDIYTTVSAVKNSGFTNFSVDLIHGIPGQTVSEWKSDLKKAIELEPNHISAYNLTVEHKTNLHSLVKSGKVTMLPEEIQASMIETTRSILESNGYYQYEISNYSKPGFECQHNLQYWRGAPYLSFGPSAHSFDSSKRWKNVKNLEKYISLVEKNASPVDFEEILSKNELVNEILGFGIRLKAGVNISNIPDDYLQPVLKNIQYISDKWEGCIIYKDHQLSLTKKGFLFADAIAVDLML